MKQVGVVVAGACLWAVSAAGQATSPSTEARPTPTFRSGVNLISLDVTVLDAKGQQVTDLQAPEFSVSVDGQSRRVVSAQFVRADGAAPNDTDNSYFTSNAGASRGRLVVFAVDQGQIRPNGVKRVLLAADRFMQRLSPLDRVAFAAIPAPGTVVPFTTDRTAIRTAMEEVVGQAQTADGWREPSMPGDRGIAVGDASAPSRECSRLDEDALQRCLSDLTFQREPPALVQREATDRSVAALRGLVKDLAKVEGQKTLLLISEGLEMDELNSSLDDLAMLAATSGVTINVMVLDGASFDVSRPSAPATDRLDRAARAEGLERLAALSRGALYRVVGDGEVSFQRLLAELSGYYLVGVEQRPADRDGRPHALGVSVSRGGVSLRARQAFVLAGAPSTPPDAIEALAAALRAPYELTELPVRVTTFLHRDKTDGQLRLLMAADVARAAGAEGDYALGFMVVDSDNRVVADAVEQLRLRPADAGADAPLTYTNVATIGPGTYTLRFGAVDMSGRRGTVFHRVRSFQMAGQDLVLGDLIVGGIATSKDSITPVIEARVKASNLAAYMELYSTSAAILDQTSVSLEVATDEQAPTLLTTVADHAASSQPTTRVVQAVLPIDLLPPGRYIARAQVVRAGKPAGPLMRPFVVLPRDRAVAGRASAVALPASLVAPPPKFDKAMTLRPEVLGQMFDLVEQAIPALKPILVGARQGRFGQAAVAALEAGHQDAASFLRGVELLGKGDLDKAANLFNLASGPRRTFFPAAFYLGVCYAAAGRDRDAAGVWQLALGSQPRPLLAYSLLVDARWRDGQLGSVLDILREAFQRAPEDDAIAKRLALVYAMRGQHADARPILDAYLQRHPTDQDVLFAAVLSTYEAGVPGAPDREKLVRYANAYTGPQQALVSRYVQAFGEQPPR